MADNYVQHATATGTTTAVVTLNSVVAGNSLAADLFDGSNATPATHTVADGQGSYTAKVSCNDPTNTVFGQNFILQNANSGTHIVTGTIPGGEQCFLMVMEVGTSSGASAYSGDNCAFQSSPGAGANALSSGSVTVTAAATMASMATDTSSVTASDEPTTGTSPFAFTTRANATSTVIGAYRIQTADVGVNGAATAGPVTTTHNFETFGIAVLNGGPVGVGVIANLGSAWHPGASPGLGGVSSARFEPSNWWPYAASASVTAALTGQRATFTAGTLTPNNTDALTGGKATFTPGALGVTHTDAVTGVKGTFSPGTVGVTHTNALAGQRAIFTPGIVSSALSVPVVGGRATFGPGTVTPVTGFVVALTGASATFSAGTLTAVAPPVTALAVTPGKLPPWPWTWTHDHDQKPQKTIDYSRDIEHAMLHEQRLRAEKRRLEQEFRAKAAQRPVAATQAQKTQQISLQNRDYAILRRKIRATERALSEAVTREIELRLKALENERTVSETVAARRQRELMMVLLLA